MAAKFFALLTNQGAAKLSNMAALGEKLEITSLAVGDGGGKSPTPNQAQTALVNEVRRAQLNSLSVDDKSDSQIIAEQIIPESVGGWWIREIGLFDADGILIAVANCPETYKATTEEGSGRTQVIRMMLTVSSTDAVTLKVDPSVVLATRQYVDSAVIEVKTYTDNALKKHVDTANPHSQYPLIENALKELADAGLVGEVLKNLGAVAGSGGSYPGDLKFKSVGTNPTEHNGITLVTPTTTAPNGFASWMQSDWYDDKVLWGILRGGSDKATGAGIQVMGLLFSFLADGTMKAGNETVAFQNWVTNNYLKKTDVGSAAGRDVGTGANQIPDTSLLDALFVRKAAVGTAAAKYVGTGANQIPDMNSFQSGSNGNGSWLRLPSGILIQFGMLPSTNPAGYSSITFPTPFTDIPVYSLAVTSSTPTMVTAVGSNSGGIIGVQTFNLAGNQLNNGVPWIAIGK